MTDEPETPTPELSADGAAGQESVAEQQTESWLPQPSPAESAYGAMATDRPEVAVGAAFAGGLLAALILKRLAR